LVALVPGLGSAPPQSLSEREARAAWAVTTALWHPQLLARCAVLPSAVVPNGLVEADPHEWRITAAQFALPELPNVLTIDTDKPRADIAAELLSHLAPDSARPLDNSSDAHDFMALGCAFHTLAELTNAMAHADVIDHASLTREVQAGARAWQAGDHNTVRNHLRAAFEVLTQARERFYPVDNYLIEWILIDHIVPDSPEELRLAQALTRFGEERVPCTFLASGRTIDTLHASGGEAIKLLLDAINQEWADVAGGPYMDSPDTFLPAESIFWQFRRAADAYQNAFEGRNIETFARRDFGLYPMLPQVARRFGIRFGYHLALDDGRFPIPRETKRLWEAPDGSSLEVLARPPLSAHSEFAGREFPWRLARTLKEDHVAALPLVHRPELADAWFSDLRRAATYSPVFGRWVTIADFFQRTDRPWDPFRPDLDDYHTPYLSQAVAAERTNPISAAPRHHRLRALVESQRWIDSLVYLLTRKYFDPALNLIEEGLEFGDHERAALDLAALGNTGAEKIAAVVSGNSPTPRLGFLVLNPLGFNRRAAVSLPGAAIDLRGEGALKAAQFTDEGVLAVVELPAHGFAWIPAHSSESPSEEPGSVRASGYTISNGLLEVEVDPGTGGLRGIRRPGEPTPRLAQQLVALGLSGTSSKDAARMVASRVEVEYGGPALAQIVSLGAIVRQGQPERPLARFEQRIRLWWGRPIVELRIEFSQLDESWFEQMAARNGDPWSNALACRWAWADAAATTRRSSFYGLETTKSERPETAEIFEIANRGQRTSILLGGLAHHQRHGARMLDTLLVAGRETERRFELGVALDLEHPVQAALDLLTPPVVVSTSTGIPVSGNAGWFFSHDLPSVVISRTEALVDAEQPDKQGVLLHFIETSGRAARGRLRFFRNPAAAQLLDLQGEHILDIEIEGDAILLDLTPREIACVQVWFS
jgi:alpha-mannosidase